MADVARAARVSPMTVSNSFRSPHLVSPTTRERVLEVAAELGYVPNAMAGNLVSGQSKVVALMTPSIRYSSFADMIEALSDGLEAEGYQMIISQIEDQGSELEALRALLGHRVDGIVAAGELQDPEARRLIRQRATPLVETWHLHDEMIDMGAGFSEADASRDAVRFVIASGRKRIGMIGLQTAGHRRLEERLNGYRAAMAEIGDPGERLVSVDPSENGYRAGADGLRQLVQNWTDLDGVFCMTDILAAGAMFECLRLGRVVPDDIAIMGYGNYDIAGELPLGLSSVQTPGSAIGEAAASLLLARFRGEMTAQRLRRLPYQVVARASV